MPAFFMRAIRNNQNTALRDMQKTEGPWVIAT